MVMLLTRKRRRNPAPVAQSNPTEMNASDDGSGTTFEPGLVVETLMVAASQWPYIAGHYNNRLCVYNFRQLP